MDIHAVRKVVWSLFWVIAMVLVCVQRGYGFFIGLPLLSLLFWIPYCLWIAVKLPVFRAIRLCQLGLWVVGIAMVIVVHHLRDNRTREHADDILHKIQDFHAAQGHYPEKLAEIGFSDEPTRRDWGIIYVNVKPAPTMLYRTSFDPFDRYIYDFANREWEYYPD